MTKTDHLKELRRALEAPTGLDRLRHRRRTEEIRASLSHSVEFHDLVENSTCLTYSLRLYKDKTYLAVAGPFFRGTIFAGRQFVEWLLVQNKLEELDNPMPGCLVLYFSDGTWKHAGTMISAQRVLSQWGTFPLYEHALFEVPTSYGNVVRYFRMPNPDEAIALFLSFAKALYEVTDQDIAAAQSYNV